MNKAEGWKRITNVLVVYTVVVIGGIVLSDVDGWVKDPEGLFAMFGIIGGLFVLPLWVVWYIVGGFIKDKD